MRLAVMGREIRKERIREGRRNVLLGGVLAVVVLGVSVFNFGARSGAHQDYGNLGRWRSPRSLSWKVLFDNEVGSYRIYKSHYHNAVPI